MPGFLRREIAMVWAVAIVLASFAGGAALALSFAGALLPVGASEAASSAGQGPPQAVSFTPPPGFGPGSSTRRCVHGKAEFRPKPARTARLGDRLPLRGHQQRVPRAGGRKHGELHREHLSG